MPSRSARVTLELLRLLPRNLLSRLVGFLADRERPRWLVRRAQRSFVRRFGLDLSEAEKPLEAYPSLGALFTRALAPGRRPVEEARELLVSPVDGRLGATGPIEEDTLVQAKGRTYRATDLLGDADLARRFESGHFVTIYLAPHDYHRIHAPEGGRIVRTLYEPGTLWPVHPLAVATVPRLFAVNERVTSVLETEDGLLAVVLVGATNVGRIGLSYDPLVTNRGARRRSIAHEPAPEIARGAHLGTFHLGSTVILLTAPECGFTPTRAPGEAVRMGRPLGRRAPRRGT